MRDYEVNFIVDPVLSGDEIKATAQTYIDLLGKEGSEITYIDEMGLRPLAYPINKRSTGIYYCVEFKVPTGAMINKFELALRRDERIMRFLTVKLDKYGVKFNDDKRNGLIGKKKSKGKPAGADNKKASNAPKAKAPTPPPAKKAAPPVEKAAPVAPAPVAEAPATNVQEEE